MIDIKQVEWTDTYELFWFGRSDARSVLRVIDRLESAIKEHGTIRLLEVIEEVGTVSPRTYVRDIRFVWRHMGDLRQVAVVGKRTWLKVLTNVVGMLVRSEVKYFDFHRLEDAREWLRQDLAAGARHTTRRAVAKEEAKAARASEDASTDATPSALPDPANVEPTELPRRAPRSKRSRELAEQATSSAAR